MLHVHRAERADRLADGLAQTLSDALDDPFEAEVVAVPTRGVERWLTQRLSTVLGATPERGDGVCANIEFPFPGRLILGTLASATGVDPEEDPWRPERLVWPLLELVDACIDEPWLHTLKAHLEGARPGPEDPIRRFGVIRHLADLYDHYGIQRPGLLRVWARAEGASIAAGDAPWQAELWRRLRAKINQPSPAERIEAATAAIREDPGILELPSRLSLFGLTRMPRSYLEVLAAIAQSRDVHLFVLHPSPLLWRQIAAQLTAATPITRREEDPTAQAPANRLLASWGRDARELQVVIASAATQTLDHHHELEQATQDSLLSHIQAAISADRPPPGEPLPGAPDKRPQLQPQDRSIEVHSCHGRARQVEVLRDALLHLLQEDPTLEPRDIIVMCPDIESFAPLIEATFGAAATNRPDLRVRLADRSLRQTNPLLNVISQLLTLAEQRVTASQLLDLADREPVRRRFGFDDDAVARMHDWVVDSGIRWGFDAPHRKPFKLDALEANTWRAGLDRILVGVAMTEHDRRLVANRVLPLDDVESGAIDLAGRFAEFVNRVQQATDRLQQAQPMTQWAEALAEAADSLTATAPRDSWQRTELQRVLESAVEQGHGSETPLLELQDVRALLAGRLRGRPTRANFRTGHLTICTLVPMRSVPHRVVCILGLDDGEFPRKAWRDGDDLILRDPHVGDRDPRAEDRQMLLDALMAATERVVITYTGNDERTNLPRPPAVPVGELLDVVDRTVRHPDGPSRERIIIRHPLQPFDPRNFISGALLQERRWSFDEESLSGARALTEDRTQPHDFLEIPLPPDSTKTVELQRLVRFVEHPTRAFLRDRLGVSVGEYPDDVRDALPVELDGLGEWQVGQRLLDGVLAGQELSMCVKAEFARGSLPPGTLANPVIRDVALRVRRIAAALPRQHSAPAASLDINLQLPDGRALTGTVPGVIDETIRVASYSRVKPKDRLRAWVWLLALTASRPEHPHSAIVVGRARSKSARTAEITIARIPPLADHAAAREREALDALTALIDLYERGMREPLPLACEASAAYAEAAYAGDDPEDAARQAWESGFRFPKEDRDPEHLIVRDGAVRFNELLAEQPRSDERGDGWDQHERTRFGRLARRLWDPLLTREEISDR